MTPEPSTSEVTTSRASVNDSDHAPPPPLGKSAIDHVRDAAQILAGILDELPPKHLDPSADVNGLISYQRLVRIRERLRLAYVQLDKDAADRTTVVTTRDRQELRRIALETHQRGMEYQPGSAGRAKWVDMAAALRAIAERGL